MFNLNITFVKRFKKLKNNQKYIIFSKWNQYKLELI
jgi:hypothetical protein